MMTQRRNDLPARAPAAPAAVARKLQIRKADEPLLSALGGALILQWDALPDALQDLLIDQASFSDDAEALPQRETFEHFIRTAKSVQIKRPDSPPQA